MVIMGGHDAARRQINWSQFDRCFDVQGLKDHKTVLIPDQIDSTQIHHNSIVTYFFFTLFHFNEDSESHTSLTLQRCLKESPVTYHKHLL